MYDKYFDDKKQLNECINDMEKEGICNEYVKRLRDIKNGLSSKKINSLKTKPLETLILFYKILYKNGIKPEELINMKKEYYIISKTPIKGNKSNFHKKGRSKEIFGFIDIIKDIPFSKVQPINETAFISLIKTLES